MESHLIKSGTCSAVFGSGHYSKCFMTKKGKLLKITKITSIQDESKYLDYVRKIDNYQKYFTIPDELSFLLKPDDTFYNYFRKLVRDTNIFEGPVNCLYIDYAGSKDMFDTLKDVISYNDFSFWSSYRKILKFSKHIITGLKFLHDSKICHLDIKPENIMVDISKDKFKIIDFGFSSIEPFHDYIMYTKGTPGYFPKLISQEKPSLWLPKIEANDLIEVDGRIPMVSNRNLVYKIDSYCFGRVLYFLKNAYDHGKVYECFNCEKKKGKKIDNIIKDLVENNVYKRLTITKCLEKYFI